AASGLKDYFKIDDDQVEAILELRLYRLVGMEVGKVIDELQAKRKEASDIRKNLDSPKRLWNLVDKELADIIDKFGDERRSTLIHENKALSLEYNPEEFEEQDDVTVILSKQGWIRRMKIEVDDVSSLKFRDGDSLFHVVRVNTSKNLALFSNYGKVYVIKAADVPATSGFGDPVSSLVNLYDGELIVGLIAPDPVKQACVLDSSLSQNPDDNAEESSDQPDLFENTSERHLSHETGVSTPTYGILVTRLGKGFRFELESLRETTKKIGRKITNLQESDHVVAVKSISGDILAIGTDDGRLLFSKIDHVPVMSGVSQGVILIKKGQKSSVVDMEIICEGQSLRVIDSLGSQTEILVGKNLIANRGTRGKRVSNSICDIECN
ncbi:MAG: DNA gyrase C-terminal beta-propeller domain-containing protein, partial [Syntrophaceae bacterium]|nr:DNA gyrase C-terminal beta-propeller domain-containing protein [Syntrophaceae bacterium]